MQSGYIQIMLIVLCFESTTAHPLGPLRHRNHSLGRNIEKEKHIQPQEIISVRVTSSVAVDRGRRKFSRNRNENATPENANSPFVSTSPKLSQNSVSASEIHSITVLPPSLAGANIEFIKQLRARNHTKFSHNGPRVGYRNTDEYQLEKLPSNANIGLESRTQENIPRGRSIPISSGSNQLLLENKKISVSSLLNSNKNSNGSSFSFEITHDPITLAASSSSFSLGVHDNTSINEANMTSTYGTDSHRNNDFIANDSSVVLLEKDTISHLKNKPKVFTTQSTLRENHGDKISKDVSRDLISKHFGARSHVKSDIFDSTEKTITNGEELISSENVDNEPSKEPKQLFNIETIKSYSEPEKVYSEPAKVYSEPAKVYGEPEKVYSEPAKVYSEPAKVYGEPAKVYSEPAKVYGEPAKVYGEPAKVYSEPAKFYGEPAKFYGEQTQINVQPPTLTTFQSKSSEITTIPSSTSTESILQSSVPDSAGPEHLSEKNYEVDEEESVQSNGRTHGIQDPESSTEGISERGKVGYVVEGRQYRKYRVEERTSDGFIVGEYGVVNNANGALRGVRYTADGNTNPKVIYEALMKFLQL